MRTIVALASLAVAALSAPQQTQAVPFASPSGLRSAIELLQISEPVLYRCHHVRRCTALGCEWRRVCLGGCPDRLSCYPLYGAYGPWGGRAYWVSFSPIYGW